MWKDIRAYRREIWATAVDDWARLQDMIGFNLALWAGPAVAFIGGIFEFTALGTWYFLQAISFAALFALLVVAPFRVWQKNRKLAEASNLDGDGPAYWEATEAIMYIAAGVPMTSEQATEEINKDLEQRVPWYNQPLFDAGENKLLEAVRSNKLIGYGQRPESQLYEEIPFVHFANEHIRISPLSNNMTFNHEVSYKLYSAFRKENELHHKWKNIKFHRVKVQVLWPSPDVSVAI